MHAPLLQLPDFTKRFVVDCDASDTGFGAVLHQGDGPIAFFSRAVAPHHAKLPAYERELIGLVKAVRNWRPYLWGRAFTVRTDHSSLKFILDQRLSTIPQHAWVSKLFGYDLMVEYRPGKQNGAADALSRRHEDALAVHALSMPSFEVFDALRQELAADQRARSFLACSRMGPLLLGGLLLMVCCFFKGKHLCLTPLSFGLTCWLMRMRPAMKVFKRLCIVYASPFTILTPTAVFGIL